MARAIESEARLQGRQDFHDRVPYSTGGDGLNQTEFSDWLTGWLEAAESTGLTQAEIERMIDREGDA